MINLYLRINCNSLYRDILITQSYAYSRYYTTSIHLVLIRLILYIEYT